MPVHRLFEAFGAGNMDGILSVLAENITVKASNPEHASKVPWYGTYQGQSGAKDFLLDWLPTLRLKPSHQ